MKSCLVQRKISAFDSCLEHHINCRCPLVLYLIWNKQRTWYQSKKCICAVYSSSLLFYGQQFYGEDATSLSELFSRLEGQRNICAWESCIYEFLCSHLKNLYAILAVEALTTVLMSHLYPKIHPAPKYKILLYECISSSLLKKCTVENATQLAEGTHDMGISFQPIRIY